MPTLVEDQTLCFTCAKTGEQKSSDNLIRFKMMLKLHLKTCKECKYDGKILSDKSNKQKIRTLTHRKHCDLKMMNISSEEREGKLIHNWD